MQIISQGILLHPDFTKANKDVEIDRTDQHLSLPENPVRIHADYRPHELSESILSSSSAVTQWRERGE
jgi:hypothetical protein